MKIENSGKQKEFMDKWGITEDDVCLLIEDDPEFSDEEMAEVDYDE